MDSLTVITTATFDAWLVAREKADAFTYGRIASRLARIEQGNFGDHKSVGEGVSEMRLDFGPGYRVYFTRRGLEVVVLLCGGDKSSQSGDIKRAKEMARELP